MCRSRRGLRIHPPTPKSPAHLPAPLNPGMQTLYTGLLPISLYLEYVRTRAGMVGGWGMGGGVMTARAGLIRLSCHRSEESPPGGQIRGRCAIKKSQGDRPGRDGAGEREGAKQTGRRGRDSHRRRKTAVKASFCPALRPGGVSTLPSLSHPPHCGGLGLTCTRCLQRTWHFAYSLSPSPPNKPVWIVTLV